MKRLFGARADATDVPGMELDTVSKYAVNILLDFKPDESPMRPEALEILRRRTQSDLPATSCLPLGIPLAGLLSGEKGLATRASAAELIKDPPSLEQTWVWIGQGYQNSGNRAKAREAYDRALQINPNDAVALKSKQSLDKGAAKPGGTP